MRINSLSFFIVTILCVVVISSCCKNALDDQHPKDLIRIDIASEVPTLDPGLAEDSVATRVAFDLFAGLVDFDQKDLIIPGMAEKWDISPDGKTYTFHLRKGLKFSDGSSITANDFVYSWRRLIDPKTASPYNFLLANVVNGQDIIAGKAELSSFGVSAPNDDTFIVNLIHADSSFIQDLIRPNTYVVSQRAIKRYGNKWTNPANIVTSGAYTLKEHIVNGYMLAQKNPNYYDAANVHINQIKYIPLEDKGATLSTYRAGGLDVTNAILPIDQYAQLKKDYPKQLHEVSQEAMAYYDFNFSNSELAKNVKLRQALSMAIDRDVLTKNVLKQGQVPLYSTVTTTIEGGKFAGIKYDWASLPRAEQIAQAKKLYAQAGYSVSRPFHATISYNMNDVHKKIALAIAAMWKDHLGIDTTLQNQEWKTFLQTRRKGDYQIARDGWIADADSVISYTNLYQCNNPQNNSHYCNHEYDALIAQGLIEVDNSKRIELYTKALQIPLNDYTVIPLFQYTVQLLVKPYVRNFTPEVNHLYNVQTKWMRF